ncbi:MAG: hypothetical protein ACLQJ0_03560 [Steroidobacteraceae bacterium]|jgi:hypothetical protein
MNCPAALLLLLGMTSTAMADTFKLDCTEGSDGKTRFALIEINTDAETIRVYSEWIHGWKSAVNVSIADATISYVEQGYNDVASVETSVEIDRVTGKYFAYRRHTLRMEGQCKKVQSDQSF